MDLLLVGIGGTLGSLARFQIGKMIALRSKSTFPVNTFMINISGAILLGLVSGMQIQGNLALLLADGFLGAFTTFSTFMYEGFNLFRENEKKNAVVYMMSTLLLGIIGFGIGYKIAG